MYTSLDQILQTFPVGFLRYLKLCLSWMAPRKNLIIEESYYTLILCCFVICEIKRLVTKNKKLLNSYICQSGCPNYQITAIVFFIFLSVGEGEGWLEVDSIWLLHYKHPDNHPAVLLNSFKFCAPVVFILILVILLLP